MEETFESGPVSVAELFHLAKNKMNYNRLIVNFQLERNLKKKMKAKIIGAVYYITKFITFVGTSYLTFGIGPTVFVLFITGDFESALGSFNVLKK